MRVLCMILAVSALAWPAFADWSPGDPYKMHYPQLPNPAGWDVLATTPKILADDFLCTETGPITDVHFWGSWQDDWVGTITNVHLSIHSNLVADRQVSYSQPGALLWSRDVTSLVTVEQPSSPQGWYNPNSGQYIVGDHTRWFQYNIDIPEAEAFVQQAGQIYWLDLQVSTANGLWGWKTSISPQFQDDAVWGDLLDQQPNNNSFFAWQPLTDPLTGQSLDLAFVITPEPASALLLLAGGGWLLRRRR